MTRYEFATLSVQTGTAAKVVAGVERYLAANSDRARLFAVWTPKGGPDWLATMQSSIFIPAKFSPLR